MDRKKNKTDQSAKKDKRPPIIRQIQDLMAKFTGEYGRPPTIVTLNHSHYVDLLKIDARHYTTIHPSTQRIDKILGMSYFLDYDEDEMWVR